MCPLNFILSLPSTVCSHFYYLHGHVVQMIIVISPDIHVVGYTSGCLDMKTGKYLGTCMQSTPGPHLTYIRLRLCLAIISGKPEQYTRNRKQCIIPSEEPTHYLYDSVTFVGRVRTEASNVELPKITRRLS